MELYQFQYYLFKEKTSEHGIPKAYKLLESVDYKNCRSSFLMFILYIRVLCQLGDPSIHTDIDVLEELVKSMSIYTISDGTKEILDEERLIFFVGEDCVQVFIEMIEKSDQPIL